MVPNFSPILNTLPPAARSACSVWSGVALVAKSRSRPTAAPRSRSRTMPPTRNSSAVASTRSSLWAMRRLRRSISAGRAVSCKLDTWVQWCCSGGRGARRRALELPAAGEHMRSGFDRESIQESPMLQMTAQPLSHGAVRLTLFGHLLYLDDLSRQWHQCIGAKPPTIEPHKCDARGPSAALIAVHKGTVERDAVGQCRRLRSQIGTRVVRGDPGAVDCRIQQGASVAAQDRR